MSGFVRRLTIDAGHAVWHRSFSSVDRRSGRLRDAGHVQAAASNEPLTRFSCPPFEERRRRAQVYRLADPILFTVRATGDSPAQRLRESTWCAVNTNDVIPIAILF
ncbi:hypothetical protein MRX96_031162 [Rhipicephalus microplus]